MSVCIRSLSPEEEDIWLDFVSSVFVNTPRDYFYRHIHNDSHQNTHEHIFVAVADTAATITQTSQIFGTLRVFQRSFMYFKNIMPVGGIGEVSVSPLHRRKGIATKLLEKAIKHMAEGNPPANKETEPHNHIYSTLHTGEAAPLYRSVGYEAIPLSFSAIDHSQVLQGVESNSNINFRKANFTGDVIEMKEIYHTYARHFVGCFTRNSNFYWEHWVQQETPQFIVAEDKETKSIVGMLGAAMKNENGKYFLLVKDFAVSEILFSKDSGESMFKLLLMSWTKTFCPKYEENKIVVPSAVCASWKQTTHSIHDIDQGVMYLKVQPVDSEECEDRKISIETDRHLFWDTDAF